MKTKTLFFSSLIAAAAMSSVPAFADEITLTNGEKTTLPGSSGTVGSGNTYSYATPSGTDKGGWLWLGNLQGTGNVAFGTSGSQMALSGTGIIAVGYQGGNGGVSYNFDFTNTDASAFSGKFAVVNEWDNNTVVKLSGEGWSNVEYVSGGVSREQSWATLRSYDNATRAEDKLELQGATTLAGITGVSKGYSYSKVSDVNSKEFVTASTSGTVLTLSGTGDYSYYGSVGTSSVSIGLEKTGMGTQTFGGAAKYLSSVNVSAGTLALTDGTVTISGDATVASGAKLDLSGATVTLSKAISNSGTVTINSNSVFVLADALGSNNTYTLISNSGTINGWDSDTLTISNFRQKDGSAFSGRSEIDVSTAGVAKITGVAFNLFWNGGTAGTWNTTEGNTIWGKDSATGTATAFVTGDNVTFDSGETVAVTIDSDGVTARTMTVSSGTVTLLSGGKVTTTDGITVNGTGTLKISSNSNIGGNVTVGTGGTFDLNGKSGDVMWNTGFSTLTLAGGKVTNTGTSVDTKARQLYTLSVTADSEIGGTGNFGLIGNGYGATTLNLGANTLTKTGDNTLWLINTTVNGAGTIKVSGGSIADNKSDSSLTLGNASIVLDGGSANFSGTVIAGASTLNGGSVDEKQMSIGTLKFGYGSGVQTLNISGKVSVTGNFQEASSGVSNGEKITLSDGANFSVGGTFGTTNANASDSGQHSYILNVGSGASFSAGTIAHGDGLTVNIGNGNASVSATTLVLNSVWADRTHSFTGQGSDVSTLSVDNVKLNTGNKTTLSVSNARFEVGAGGITGNSSTPVSLNGVTLGVRDGADSWSSSLAMTLAGAMGADVASDKSITLDGVLSGTTTGFTKTGDGTLTLGGANTFSGGVTISAGKLVANNANALGAAAGSVKIAGGQLEVSSGITLVQTNITIALSDAYSTEAAIAAILGDGALAEGTTITLTKAEEAVIDSLVKQTKEYQIFASGTSLASNFSVESFTLDEEAWANWKISGYDTSTGKVTLEMIPEPSAFGLLAGVGALVFVAARRRRRAK